MRYRAIRSVRGHAQQHSIFPWRGYFLWVGAALLLVLVGLGGLPLRTAFSEFSGAEVNFPPIRIHTAIKGPEAVVIDTGQAILPAFPDQQATATLGIASLNRPGAPLDQSAGSSSPQEAEGTLSLPASAAGSGAREAFARLAQPDQPRSSPVANLRMLVNRTTERRRRQTGQLRVGDGQDAREARLQVERD
jgi:hypothetical protein